MKKMPMRKRFGQHFLHDSFVLQKIVSAIHPQKTDTLVEIGPGRGALTDYLLTECDNLALVEIDGDLVAFLQKKYNQQKNITIYQNDALQFDFSSVKTDKPLRVVGNLPYNISTPLLFHLFSQIHCIEDMHFMLQKEVVRRITAEVGSHDYGRLSVMAQYFCDNTYLFTVSPQAFTPPPRVESAIIRLIPRHNFTPVAKNLDQLSHVVKEAFSYRRKTVGNALKKLINPSQWPLLEINPQLRPQELTVEDFVKISNILN
ncbi:ribosomal RNA small subunit methyltransferase A [Coxiella burnetii]|uniref:Ribosomal RNA small subunit methyltransferase A n=1 Tax=Coxiella burnetii (strain Dugway 5J108-111) TaxID=434922 RepID=RSMA_COXBN|nr:16S rRNA (adenine(1518)-N(6)/adenine(1519)-N(6))-dimethyltransferase RsmA [Coxiella burnetii]A9KGZ8.1 RecName: Full=Ribosomal RNA small subunit methyltransferase A; AltName: Full=16S rRNA (adenine(1518)-N(6)/adenine(1519)-N(6))-dimethyltransferase; AltName: Full=16S rRNA dimethyladenosine transferase; AltName: Full=16S rRNA dimethylase; AltName: Full=S-adenosylmethionine-6-N', N'-adenosyl(rRNA) dimethyltransferase [Coxiella burnetii Dugway 5J108-111]ABS78047.1 dimethyladenosine transferase [Co